MHTRIFLAPPALLAFNGGLDRLPPSIKFLISFWASILFATSNATADEFPAENNPIKLGGYIETYYVHDFNHPANHAHPDFIYSFNRSDTPSINLALIKANYNKHRFRANLALGSGTYMRSNYAAEPEGLQHLVEANAGIKLSDHHAVWLDVGVMPSHIGFESAIGVENWTLSRSLMADNSPYFETGIRVSYTSPDSRWYASGLLLNGWQRIQRANGNTTPAIGHQLTYRPNSRLTLNSSSFIGNDQSDRERQMRYFHHFYSQFALNDAWSLMAGLDVGAQQRERGSSHYNVWVAPIAMVRYRYSDKLFLAARYEYYEDRDGVIIDTGTPHGFRTAGYSVNLDYQLNAQMMLRAELRKLDSKDNHFNRQHGDLVNHQLTATTSLAISF